MDLTQVSNMFNKMSTIAMVFFVAILLSWMPLIGTESLGYVEKIASRLYLENYKV